MRAARSLCNLAGGVFVVVWLSASSASAQPYVSEPGSLGTSFDYSLGLSKDVVLQNGDLASDSGFMESPTTTHSFVFGIEYVPIEKLAVDATIPVMLIKYTGEMDHAPVVGAWDDGDMHATLQDFRLNARYQVLAEPLAFTPHLGFTIPMMDYETNGFANVGRHLKQLHIGASVGRTLEPVLENLFIVARYEFTLSEKFDETPETEEVGQNRSDIDLMIGYAFLDGKLGVNVAGNWRIAHGGVGFDELTSPPLNDFHDPLLDEEFIYLGGGADYTLSETLSVGAFTRFYVHGQNTRTQNLFGLNVSWQVR